MSFKFGKRSLNKLVGVQPMLIARCYDALQICKVDFAVIEGVRSFEKQKEYVANGTSKTLDSYHLYGLAVDLVPYISGVGLTWDDDEAFAEIRTAMSKANRSTGRDEIENGFDLWGWDKPHYQLTGWKRYYDVRKIHPNKIW